MSPHLYAGCQLSSSTLKICSTGMTRSAEMDHVPSCREHINITQALLCYPNLLLFIFVSLSVTPSMNTRKKNKSKHPGIPDMTPSQLSSAGLSHAPATRRRGPTKDQQITALKDELRDLRELISNVTRFTLSLVCNIRLTDPSAAESPQPACGA